MKEGKRDLERETKKKQLKKLTEEEEERQSLRDKGVRSRGKEQKKRKNKTGKV